MADVPYSSLFQEDETIPSFYPDMQECWDRLVIVEDGEATRPFADGEMPKTEKQKEEAAELLYEAAVEGRLFFYSEKEKKVMFLRHRGEDSVTGLYPDDPDEDAVLPELPKKPSFLVRLRAALHSLLGDKFLGIDLSGWAEAEEQCDLYDEQYDETQDEIEQIKERHAAWKTANAELQEVLTQEPEEAKSKVQERLEQEEAAQKQKEEEAEAERKQQEEAEAELKRKEAEAERKRQEAEAEAERKRQEAEAEAERKRQEAEAETAEQKEEKPLTREEKMRRLAELAAEERNRKLKQRAEEELAELKQIPEQREQDEKLLNAAYKPAGEAKGNEAALPEGITPQMARALARCATLSQQVREQNPTQPESEFIANALELAEPTDASRQVIASAMEEYRKNGDPADLVEVLSDTAFPFVHHAINRDGLTEKTARMMRDNASLEGLVLHQEAMVKGEPKTLKFSPDAELRRAMKAQGNVAGIYDRSVRSRTELLEGKDLFDPLSTRDRVADCLMAEIFSTRIRDEWEKKRKTAVEEVSKVMQQPTEAALTARQSTMKAPKWFLQLEDSALVDVMRGKMMQSKLFNQFTEELRKKGGQILCDKDLMKNVVAGLNEHLYPKKEPVAAEVQEEKEVPQDGLDKK